MKMPHRIRVKCPYCGYENTVVPVPDNIRPFVVLCDIDDGPGCDRYFAVEIKFKPVVSTYRIIEEKRGE